MEEYAELVIGVPQEKLSLALILILVISGCTASPNQESTTTYISELKDGQTPKKGTELLAVDEIDRTSAMTHKESSHASFENLTGAQQTVFMRALKCSCNVKQNIFKSNDEDRVKVVRYEGDYYYLRVSIV